MSTRLIEETTQQQKVGDDRAEQSRVKRIKFM